MPLYEFRCSSCHAVFERLCSFAQAEGGLECGVCATGWAERIDSLPALPQRGGPATPPPANAPKAASAHPAGCGCAMHRAAPKPAVAKSS